MDRWRNFNDFGGDGSAKDPLFVVGLLKLRLSTIPAKRSVEMPRLSVGPYVQDRC